MKIAAIFLLAVSAAAQQPDVKPPIELTSDQKIELYTKRIKLDEKAVAVQKAKLAYDKWAQDQPQYKAILESGKDFEDGITELKKRAAEIIAQDQKLQNVSTPTYYKWETNEIVDYDPYAPAKPPVQKQLPVADPVKK